MGTSSLSSSEPDYCSVALIGSSGGGTATLGHTDPVELLTAIHRELIRVRSDNERQEVVDNDDADDPGDDNGNDRSRRRRVCAGLSHAIFVSLADGSGFDSVREEDWMPDDARSDDDDGGGSAGPRAALYTVGFQEHNEASSGGSAEEKLCNRPFRVELVDEGSLTKINRHARRLDEMLGRTIRSRCGTKRSGGVPIAALISLSSEPTNIHSQSLASCAETIPPLPVVGSGGTSLSTIATLYDLRIVGNSGGSVASTTLTKARGWAAGLAEEWGMVYDATMDVGDGSGDATTGVEKGLTPKSAPIPTLKSILEAALPVFLFVCIALRCIHAWEVRGSDASGWDDACLWKQQGQQNEQFTPIVTVKYALRHIVIGTTLSVLAATSRSSSTSSSAAASNPSGDQSTLLMSSGVAGVIASASASQSVFFSSSTSVNADSYGGGGSALAGLIAGASIPIVLAKVSHLCHRYHITATMTNILCGGGVGMMVGMLMHLSGLAHAFALITEVVRCLLRWKKLDLRAIESDAIGMSVQDVPSLLPNFLARVIFPILSQLQEKWCILASNSAFSSLFYRSLSTNDCAKSQSLPMPIGLGFLHGIVFVYGSKIGWYHSIFLPLILLEMDAAPGYDGASLFGAMDECALAMVCAGICAGNLILPPKGNGKKGAAAGGGQASLAWQALKTNLICGDFIEAAYPSMERSSLVNGSAYLAAGLSTEVLLRRRVLSTAYLPLPLAIWVSNDRWGMAMACSVAFLLSLLGTLCSNVQ